MSWDELVIDLALWVTRAAVKVRLDSIVLIWLSEALIFDPKCLKFELILVSASLSKKKFNWKQRSVLVNFLPFFWKCKYTQNRHLKKERFTIQLKGSRKSLCGERAFAVKITWTTKKSEKRMVSMTTTKMTNAVANTSTWRINQLMRTRSRKRIALTPRSKDIETETELTTP